MFDRVGLRMDHDKTEACPFTRERDKPSLDLGEALYIGTMDNLRKPALVLRPHPPPPQLQVLSGSEPKISSYHSTDRMRVALHSLYSSSEIPSKARHRYRGTGYRSRVLPLIMYFSSCLPMV